MAKRVNNIAYKGINHSPSLVSDNDGHASECINLSPDYNDLKPMPMPVKNSNYKLEIGYSLFFVHQGIGYENYVEIDETHSRLVFKDAEGNYLYYAYNSPDFPYWTNESEILAIEAMGNTVIVSTKEGVEYIIFQPDVPIQGQTGGSYKPIGQRPPMPVIEFRLHEENNDLTYYESSLFPTHNNGSEDGELIQANYDSVTGKFWYDQRFSNDIADALKPSIAKIQTRAAQDRKFIQPFFVRYAIRLRTGDYIMQSPPILLAPSDGNPFITTNAITPIPGGTYRIGVFILATHASSLQYKIVNYSDFGDWKEIVDTIDVFISEQINTFDIDNLDGNNRVDDKVYLSTENETNIGRRYVDGEIKMDVVQAGNAYYNIKTINPESYENKVEKTVLFHNISSLDINEIQAISNYQDLPIDNLANLATLPTLEDDYNSHCAVSPLLMQVYNSRLNMANISQMVFKGFEDAYQPQPADPQYHVGSYYIRSLCVYFKVKKNGKTYIVRNQSPSVGQTISLNYTTYLYYPDPDCYEAIVYFGENAFVYHLLTIPMKRHETLNGAYWYDNMNCLAQYILDNESSWQSSNPMPVIDTDLWYDIPNRFMMSSVGNPWHFPIGNQFDIGRREIRALSLNAENMNAPQFGQNPIYVFSADGIWTIAINADGTFNKLSYVSGDVVSEMAAIGNSPTAAGAQMVFFKTSRGISAIVGSAVKEIDIVMKGRLFNPRTMLLPQGSIVDGVPTSGIDSYWLDVIFKSCDNIPYADFARQSNLIYDYRNNRLLLYHKDVAYMYVYDIGHDFWSKMLPIVIDESDTSPAEQEYNARRGIVTVTTFNGTAMVGNNAILTDTDGYLWDVGGQHDENDIQGRFFGLYVSRPLRFGTDDMKTLSRIVHDHQLGSTGEAVKMALYGSRNGKDYYQVKTLRGTAYKFYIIVLYTKMLASSRYAYTAFEWEARMTDKIR